MRDRNPALPSKVCPKCCKLGFRLYITMFFIEHYGAYCTECKYKTEPSPGEISGCAEWVNAGIFYCPDIPLPVIEEIENEKRI